MIISGLLGIVISQEFDKFFTNPTCCPSGVSDGHIYPQIDEFIFRASEIHGNKYDYSEVSFKNVESLISIRCKEHGVFKQRLFSHLKGFNCPKCGRVSTTKILKHNEKRFKSDAEKAFR